jgi:hypothetical protein
MSALRKQLIIVDVRPLTSSRTDNTSPIGDDNTNHSQIIMNHVIDELAVASGHAPFRHRRKETAAIGSQTKKLKTR